MNSQYYQSYNAKMEDILPTLESESVDVIITDPPYLYLKNQKLDVPFDEQLFFNEAKRVLKKNGFIVLFGRGTSFYRWNTILADLGFIFKEEIIWDKRRTTSPLSAIGRVHESISIFCNGCCNINKVKVPYLEIRGDISAIIQDIKRIKPILKNQKELQDVEEYLKSGIIPNRYGRKTTSTSVSSCIETPSPCVNTVRAIKEGLLEKTIIQSVVARHNAIHPTQKPVRLLERLLALVLPKDVETPIILDPFGGSFSTVEASLNMSCFPITIEMDKEFFDKGTERIESYLTTFTEEKQMAINF